MSSSDILRLPSLSKFINVDSHKGVIELVAGQIK